MLNVVNDDVLEKFKVNDAEILRLEDMNNQQDEIIQAKQNEIRELNNMVVDMNKALNLTDEEKNMMEIQYGNLQFELENITNENVKIRKQKEAEILRLQLAGSENILELQEQIKLVKNERDQSLIELRNFEMIQKNRGENFPEDIPENLSPAEKRLIERDIVNSIEFTELLNRGVPRFLIPKTRTRLSVFSGLINNLDNQQLKFILKTNPKTQTQLREEIQKLNNDPLYMERLTNEMTQNIQQVAQEMEAEEDSEIESQNLFDIENSINTIKNNIDNRQNTINKKNEELKELILTFETTDTEVEELITEYMSLIDTLGTSFEDNDISNIDEISKIENQRDRESLLALYNYVNDNKTILEEAITDMKQKINKNNEKIELMRGEITIEEIELEELKEQFEKRTY